MAKKNKTGENLGSRLALVMKSGKYTLGYKSTLKSLRSDKCKLVLICTFSHGSCPRVGRLSRTRCVACGAAGDLLVGVGTGRWRPCGTRGFWPLPVGNGSHRRGIRVVARALHAYWVSCACCLGPCGYEGCLVQLEPLTQFFRAVSIRRRPCAALFSLCPSCMLMAQHSSPCVASNTQPLRRSELEYYAMLAKCNVHHFPGNNVDLGTACGKYFRCSAVGITDQGDSDIIRALDPASQEA